MINVRNELMFISTVNMAKKMLSDGLINKEEYREIIRVFTEKYSPIISTITLDL